MHTVKSFRHSIYIFSMLCSSILYGGNNVADTANTEVVSIEKSYSGLYGGLGIAFKELENEGTSEKFKSTDIGLIAGYRFNLYYAIEARYYASVGDVEYKHGTTDNTNIDDYDSSLDAIGIYLKLSYPIKKIEPYILLGYSNVWMDNLEGEKRNEDDFSYGIGLGYYISDNLEVFIDYAKLYDDKGFGGRAITQTIDTDVWMMGVNYAF